MKSKQVIVNLTEKLSKKQLEFIKNSCSDSFPNQKIIFNKNIITIENNKKKNVNEILKSIKKLSHISKRINNSKIIFNQIRQIKFKKDPLKILKKNNEVKKISKELFQFEGDFLNIFRKCNNFFYKLAVKKYKALDQENPVLWPIDLYKKINYLNEFPQQSLFMVGLKKNHNNLKNFANRYSGSKKFNNIKINNNFENAEYGLQPAVCDNCYYTLSNLKSFKNTIYTTYNKVFRNENSKNNSLDRLMSFSVRDIMFVGDKNFVIKTRNSLIEDLKIFLKKLT